MTTRAQSAPRRNEQVIRAKGQIDLEPRRELWRLAWSEYSDSRLKQFNAR